MKKIISVILIMILSLSIGTSVYSADTSVSSAQKPVNAENADWLRALGISTNLKNETATRGEFLCALIKMMNFSSASASKNYFSDVSKDSELGAAVEYAINLGIIGQAENFDPDRAISYYEACKMAVVALGYDINAKANGGYPYGYANVASKLNLTSGSESAVLYTADYIEFLAILSHTVIRDVSVIDSVDGEWYINYEKGVRFVEKYRGLRGFEGIVEANEFTHIYSPSKAASDGKIVIDEISYDADFRDFKLGTYVYGYTDSDDKIFYSWQGDNEIIRITSVNEPSYKSGTLFYCEQDSNREKKISIPSDAAILLNGVSVMSDSSLYCVEDGYIELINNDSDSDVEIVSVYKSDFIDVSSASAANEFIRDANTNLNLSLKDKKYNFVGIDFSSVKAGMCLEYFKSPDGMYYEFRLCNTDVSGSVTMLGNNQNTIYIDDFAYETTSYFDMWYKNLVVLNSSVKVARSSDGKLVKAEIISASSMKYGYFYDCKYNSQGLNKEYAVKIYTEDGNSEIFSLSDKLVFNGASETDVSVYGKLENMKESLIRYQVKDGKITKINTDNGQGDFYNPSADGSDALKRYHYKGYDSTTETIPYVTGYFVPYFFVGSNTVVFAVKSPDKESDENKRFYVGTGAGAATGMNNTAKSKVCAFNVGKDGYAGAILYIDDGYRDTYLGTLSAPHAVVCGATKTIDADGDESYCISLYWGDNYTDLYIDPDTDFINTDSFRNGYKDGEIPFCTGDYIRYNYSGNTLVYASKAYDAKTGTLNATQKYHNSELNFYYGQLTGVSDASCSLLITKDDNHIGSECYYPLPSTIVVVKKNGHVITRPVSEISTYVDNDEICKGVLISCSNSSTKAAIVYEK